MNDNFGCLQAALVAAGLAFSQLSAAQQQDATQNAPVEQAAPDISQNPPVEQAAPGIPQGQPGTAPGSFQQGTAAEPFGPIGAAGIPVGEQGGAGIPFGPMTVYPGVGVALKHDDNLFLSNANRKSSPITVVSPIVRLEAQNRGNFYDLTYRADLANYWDSSADNFNDQQFVANANWLFSSKARLRLHAEYLDLHDPRGSTDRPSGTEPDRWHAPGISGVFSYGGIGAIGRIEVESGYQSKRYNNNRTVTAASDRDTTFLGGTFFYRVMPKTSLLFQIKQTKLDYTTDTSFLSSSERRYLAGVTWEATAKTTGIFKIGQVRKDFDSGTRQDYSGTTWEGEVIWSPLTYSTFHVTTSQQPYEATSIGDFILATSIYGVWTHAWNSRTTSNVSLGFRNDDYKGGGTGRNDNTRTAGLQLTYQMRRWLNAGAGYTYIERSSNIPVDEYNRNLFMLTLGATM